MATDTLPPPTDASPVLGVPLGRDEKLPDFISVEHAGLVMTAAEFDDKPFEEWDRDYRYDLVNGVLVVAPAPGGGEVAPNDYLPVLFDRYVVANPEVIDETLPEQYIPIPGQTRRRCDRGIWIGLGRVPKLGVDVPTIAIEFVSNRARDRRRDYVSKRAEYAAAGGKEYWVIDHVQRTMTVFRDPADPLVVKEGETYTTELLPGFELPLSDLLQRADRHA